MATPYLHNHAFAYAVALDLSAGVAEQGMARVRFCARRAFPAVQSNSSAPGTLR
jgi:hypothetical protein